MPLRRFSDRSRGRRRLPALRRRLAEKLDDPSLDRNVVVRDALAQLYLGRTVDHEASSPTRTFRSRPKTLLASFDPRNGTLEAEYYREIDLEKWAPVKPLLWFWQMFDHSPVGRNVRLGTQMRYDARAAGLPAVRRRRSGSSTRSSSRSGTTCRSATASRSTATS